MHDTLYCICLAFIACCSYYCFDLLLSIYELQKYRVDILERKLAHDIEPQIEPLQKVVEVMKQKNEVSEHTMRLFISELRDWNLKMLSIMRYNRHYHYDDFGKIGYDYQDTWSNRMDGTHIEIDYTYLENNFPDNPLV